MRLAAIVVAGATVLASGAAQAGFVTNAVSNSTWELSYANGGLGGGAAYLNSNGGDPFNSGAWVDLTAFGSSSMTFYANLGAAGTFANSAVTGFTPFGASDTTSYGQWFVAPDNATLSEYDFFISNPNPGTNATFVFATWDPSKQAPGSLLYNAASFVASGGSFVENVNVLPNIALTSGQDYIAFLTVSDSIAVPEPSTWGMLGLGFVGLAFAGRRGHRLSARAG